MFSIINPEFEVCFHFKVSSFLKDGQPVYFQVATLLQRGWFHVYLFVFVVHCERGKEFVPFSA